MISRYDYNDDFMMGLLPLPERRFFPLFMWRGLVYRKTWIGIGLDGKDRKWGFWEFWVAFILCFLLDSFA
jgi:hypothetical protein